MGKGYRVIEKGTGHPQFVDYKCLSCGTVLIDVFYMRKADIRPEIQCECGSQAKEVWLRRNFIHSSLSSMYGKPQPETGYETTFENYSDKVAYGRKHGLTESNDPVGGSRSRSDEAMQKAYDAEKRPRTPGASYWLDDPPV